MSILTSYRNQLCDEALLDIHVNPGNLGNREHIQIHRWPAVFVAVSHPRSSTKVSEV